jgi:hypothetical protein
MEGGLNTDLTKRKGRTYHKKFATLIAAFGDQFIPLYHLAPNLSNDGIHN